MKVLICPDKFRGSASASELATGASAAVKRRFGDAVHVAGLPLADGGEGTLEALGGANKLTTVTGPLGQLVEAPWRLAQRVAVIEMARASGLALIGGKDHNDPLAASTGGTGALIAEAAERGAERIIVGVGGSATTDGGLGALQAMYPLERYRGIEVIVACDVETEFVDAARVFGPQKGASEAQVRLLTARLERLVDAYRDDYGVDLEGIRRAGAAGGLAGGLAAGVGAELLSGFEVVADEVDLDEHLADADLVVTGEGALDATSFEGKVVGGVIAACRSSVPVVAVCGAVADDLPIPNGVRAVSLSERFGLEASMADAAACFAQVCVDVVGEKFV